MRIYFFIILFISVSLSSLAQNESLKFEHYDDGDGLSHNAVRHIVQDKYGFLWLGTFGGFNRFDGYQFKSYLSSSDNENYPKDDDITALYYDEDENRIWIGTRGGLSVLDLMTYKFETFLPDTARDNSIPEKEIRSIFKDHLDRIWIGTKDCGLGIFNRENNSFKSIEVEGLSYVKVITQDHDGDIWVGSYQGFGVARLKMNSDGAIVQINRYEIKHAITNAPVPYVSFIYEDDDCGLLVGTRGGLFQYDKALNEFVLLSGNSPFIHFTCMTRSADNSYYIGTIDGLVVTKSLEEFEQGKYKDYVRDLSNAKSLIDNQIKALFFDNSEVLWVGTENGLEKIDPYDNQFCLNTGISNLIGNKESRISGFAKSYDDKLVVATRHEGLFLVNLEEAEYLYKDIDIASVYSFDGKTFYCGLWNGDVMIYNYLDGSSEIINFAMKAFPVMSFAEINNSTLLLGTFGSGTFTLDLNTRSIRPYNKEQLAALEVSKLVVDVDNDVWMATESGVVFVSPSSNKTKFFVAKESDSIGLPSNSVGDIYIDREGVVWAASRRGLCYFDPLIDDFVRVQEIDNHNNSWVTDVVTDEAGVMWLNLNNNRIAKYDKKSKDYRTYRVNSGNRLDVFSKSSFYYYNEDFLLLGGQEGIIHFSPSGLKDNVSVFKPFISSFKIHTNEVKVGEDINGQVVLNKAINEVDEIRLSYNNRDFSIGFSAPLYVQEKYNKFRYQLEGYEDGWNSVGSFQRTVQYSNLFFGKYTFKVQVQNNHGYWSKISAYPIVILRPFWLSYYALLIYFALIFVGVLITRRIIRRQLTFRYELSLQKVKRDRDEKLNQDKLRFFTNISHELRTPLTLILGPVRQLLQDDTNDRHMKSYQMINNNADRLLNLVNQILDFRKVQDGNLRLKVTETDIYAYFVSTYHSFKYLADEKNIKFDFISEEKDITGWIDSDKYDKILYNLLSNAFKFTHKKGKVMLKMELIKGDFESLKVSVIDSGIGLSEKEKKEVFNRFYQAKSGLDNNTGTGIGLNLAKNLVQVHKGELYVESVSGKGSEFTFTIPIAKEAYSKEELFDLKSQKIVDLQTKDKDQILLPETELKDKVLLVEDNPELRAFIKDYLSNDYEVYDAENGKEGLEKCKEFKPMMCVVDVMMPVMDGLEFCTALKNDVQISHIPVVLLTALNEDENKIKGYKAGADGYLGKPFEPELLGATIESIIDNRKRLKEQFLSEETTAVNYVSHSPADELFMNNLKEFVEANMDNSELDIKAVCNALAMSSSKLYRKLKEVTDLSPNEFIRTMRLKKSTELISTQRYNISEVALMVGFNDPLYFSRCFKKQFGVSPSQY